MPEPTGAPAMSRLVLFWAVVSALGATAVALLGRYGGHLIAFGFLYAALATSWSWLRATGLFSLGHAAFFGAGALMQAWLVTTVGAPAPAALVASAAAGAVAALPLILALRLGTAAFSLATLAYATLLKGIAGNVRALGPEGFLLPVSSGFDGATPAVVTVSFGLALAATAGYELFLQRPAGRAAAALRQQPETASSLGIDPISDRWRPLTLAGALGGAVGGLHSQLLGSVETNVVFSPIFSLLPLVFGMLGGALHPLGAVVGTLLLYPLDELVLRSALPHAHMLIYGFVLVALLLLVPGGLLKARTPRIPAAGGERAVRRKPFPVTVSNLLVRRGGAEVVRNIDLRLEPGRMVRVLGPNGAGKTSLLLAIAGRVPSEGSISFGGAPAPASARERVRRGVARTFQVPRPFPEWTVRENVAMASERGGGGGPVDELLEELQLTNLRDRPADELSVGEAKRLEIARALASGPAVLLLDEPLAGLAPDAARRVTQRVERARREGLAILWIEHGAAELGDADQLLVLDAGGVRFLGPPAAWSAERPASSS